VLSFGRGYWSTTQPPITFQPPPPPGNPAAAASASNGGAAQGQAAQAAKQPEKPAQPDLITRYKLSDKVGQADADEDALKKGWSNNRDERQSLLQKRRDQMILEARRKMEAKIAADKAAVGDGA
jgi:coupling of ubiquitin conjugation to ER degradation protein 1